MKMMKRILCVLLALSLLAALSACGSFTPRVLIASQKMSKLQSMHSDTTLKLEAAAKLFGEELPLSLELRIAGDHQKEPGRAFYDATLTVSEFTKQVLIYTAKDAEEQQHGYYSADEGATWVEAELTADTEESAEEVTVEKSDFFKLVLGLADLFEEAGTLALPTGEAYVYEGVIPAAYLQELLLGFGAVEMLDEQMPFVVDDSYLALVGDVPTKLALDKQSSMLVRVELDLTQAFAKLAAVLLKNYLAEYGVSEMVELQVDTVSLITDLSGFDSVSVTPPEFPAAA